jgi:hypothetical protein
MREFTWGSQKVTMVVAESGEVFTQSSMTKLIFDSIFSIEEAKKMFSHFRRDFTLKTIVIDCSKGVMLENMISLESFFKLVPSKSWGDLCTDMCLYRVLYQICYSSNAISVGNPDNPDLPRFPELNFVIAV